MSKSGSNSPPESTGKHTQRASKVFSGSRPGSAFEFAAVKLVLAFIENNMGKVHLRSHLPQHRSARDTPGRFAGSPPLTNPPHRSAIVVSLRSPGRSARVSVAPLECPDSPVTTTLCNARETIPVLQQERQLYFHRSSLLSPPCSVSYVEPSRRCRTCVPRRSLS